jgi:predicted O-methyltransferase YrrM
MVGDAMKIVPQLKRSFDLVFIDADKGNYLNYYSMVMKKIRKGGYIIIDNVLWSGKVLDKVQDNDEDTKVLIELNKTIHEDSRVEEVLLPIRDGLFVVRVK